MVNFESIQKLPANIKVKGFSLAKQTESGTRIALKEGQSLYENSEIAKKLTDSMIASSSMRIHGEGGIAGKKTFKTFELFRGIDPNVHTYLPALNNLCKSQSFQTLSPVEQKICKATALISKILENNPSIDRKNPPADLLEAIKKIAPSFREEERIKGIITSENILDSLNSREFPDVPLDSQKFKDYALIKNAAMAYRKAGDIQIVKTLAENGFLGKYDDNLHGASLNVIEKFINKMHSNGIWLPVTQIPKASEIKKVPVLLGEGAEQTRNVVVDMRTEKLDELGFPKGTSLDNMTAISHAVKQKEFYPGLWDMLTTDGDNSILSTSYFTPGHWKTFGNLECGLLLDADAGNIAAAANSNMNSGLGKDLTYMMKYIYSSFNSERCEFADAFTKIGGYSKDEYAEIFRDIAHLTSLDQIKDPKIRETMEKTIEKVIVPDIGINEILTHAPKPTAVFAKCDSVDEVHYNLRKYAEEKNLPILLVGKEEGQKPLI